MRILVTSTPGTGHLHPIVPLAQELQSAGHDVVWATAADSCPAVERFGFRAAPAGMSSGERTAKFAATWMGEMLALPPRDRRAIAMPAMFADVAAPAMYDDLVAVFDEVQPDLVLHDLAELVAAPIATNRGVPHVTIGFGAALADSLLDLLLERIAPIWERQGVSPTPVDFHGSLLLHPFPLAVDTPRSDGPTAAMRPLSFDGANGVVEPPWAKGFGSARPGVYVTFGTEMGPLAPWPAILEAVGGMDIDVVVTVGGQVDIDGLGPIPNNVRVERYVPQSFLIGRSSLVISHAGSGSIIATAAAGKPHLSIPLAADNWDNADLLAGCNAAVTLEPDQRDAASVRAAIASILANPTMQSVAATLEQAFAAMPHPREVAIELEQLI